MLYGRCYFCGSSHGMHSEMQPVIGLEVHVRLRTKTKTFCSCPNEYGAPPNSLLCPVCAGLPGALPVLNEQAVYLALLTARALRCEVPSTFSFCRKNYAYPDLPKGYQITQLEHPIAVDGMLRFELVGSSGTREERVARVRRIQIEEDAGKTTVEEGREEALVDLNRAGVPLLEIVCEPDLHSSAEAVAFLKELRGWLMALGVTDGQMEQGSFRCDVNVSVRASEGAPMGERVELKNLNSFQFIRRAIDYEIERQTELIGRGEGPVPRETRGWDEVNARSYLLRSKEQLQDYRYFPEPDLPVYRVSAGVLELAEERLVPQPMEVRRRWVAQWSISEDEAMVLGTHWDVARFFEDVAAEAPDPKAAAHLVASELMRDVQVQGPVARIPWRVKQIVGLLKLEHAGEISGKQVKQLLRMLRGKDDDPEELVERLGIKQISDEDELQELCQAAIRQHPGEVERYRQGKKGLLGFFVAQVMRASGGQANPAKTSALLRRLLGDGE